MKNIFKKSTIASLAFTLLLGGCTSDFEEINTDPDALPTGSPTNQLGYTIRVTGSRHGAYDGTEAWAGYVVKIQYMDTYRYEPTNNTYGNKFSACYRNIQQLNDILESTEANKDDLKNIRWATRIWSEYLWLLNTDQFGDIPYTEANKVADGLIKAKYDAQSEIYPKILSNLKTIADEMAGGLGKDDIGEGDFLFGGNAGLWQKFCNSLRLRAAMRIVNVAPELAKSTIEEIGQNLSKYPVLSENEENAYLWWQGSKPWNEPWANDALSRDDYGPSNIFVEHLLKMEDPRIDGMLVRAKEDDQFRGYENGALKAPANLNSISRVSDMYRKDVAGFTPFLKSCENYFILAEAALRGWQVGMSAEEAYNKAVRLSLEEHRSQYETTMEARKKDGLIESYDYSAEIEKYMAGKGKFANTLDQIYMEEWVALFKNNCEAWSLYRRTGFPKEIQTSGEYPGAYCAYGTDHNDVPFRFPYPDNEYNYNTDNVNAASAGIVDYTWGKQMWWDTRTGVK